MNVTIARKDILRLVARAAPVADRRGTMPILGCVLLRAKDGTMTVSATDLYLSMSGSAGADVAAPGAIALPARDLLDRIKAMPDGPITIIADDKTTTIKGTGARRYKMSHLRGEEFPELPANTAAAEPYAVPCVDVATVLARASYAVSPDETRPNLNSLELTFSGGRLGATGTDGHRLAHHDVECETMKDGPAVLLPLKGAKELAKLVADGGTVSLAPTDRWLFATIDECTLSCKLAEAAFPAWRNVIPKGDCVTVDVPRRALLDCVRAVSVASPASTNGVRLTFAKGVLGIASDSPEKGDAADEVPIDYSARKPVTIGFAARYLTEALECLEWDPVSVEVRGELDPIVIRDGAYAGIVMPMRILQWATQPKSRGRIRLSTHGSAAPRSARAARTVTPVWRRSRGASEPAASNFGARTPRGTSPATRTGGSRSRGTVRRRRQASGAASSARACLTCSRTGRTLRRRAPASGR